MGQELAGLRREKNLSRAKLEATVVRVQNLERSTAPFVLPAGSYNQTFTSSEAAMSRGRGNPRPRGAARSGRSNPGVVNHCNSPTWGGAQMQPPAAPAPAPIPPPIAVPPPPPAPLASSRSNSPRAAAPAAGANQPTRLADIFAARFGDAR